MFDHLALATRDAIGPMGVLVGELGGTVTQGAEAAGFRPVQVHLGDAARGLTIELLEPFAVDRSDFLVTFLERNGEGPHHLTFKVRDFHATLDRARALGLHPTGIVDGDRWQEAFLSPREVGGTVIQLASGGMVHPDFAAHFAAARRGAPYGEPRWWPDPPPRAPEVVIASCVVMRGRDPDHTAMIFGDLCGGRIVGHDDGCVEFEWPGQRRLRVCHDGGAPGIDHVELEAPSPSARRELIVAGTRFVIR